MIVDEEAPQAEPLAAGRRRAASIGAVALVCVLCVLVTASHVAPHARVPAAAPSSGPAISPSAPRAPMLPVSAQGCPGQGVVGHPLALSTSVYDRTGSELLHVLVTDASARRGAIGTPDALPIAPCAPTGAIRVVAPATAAP